MADKAITELVAAEQITATDLFVLQQNDTAKKLPGQVLLNWLTAAADGHGGIQSWVPLKTEGLVKTFRVTLADQTYIDIDVVDGRGVEDVRKIKTEGLVDTYQIIYNDGPPGTFTVTNGEKGDKGDNADIWIRYASQKPTAESHSFGELPDAWIGVASGHLASAPTDWQAYTWYQWKGEKGDTGDPAKRLSVTTAYQVGDAGNIIPSGSWLSSIPYVAPGKYLWIRKTTVWNKGDPDVDYSVSRMGIDGTGAVSTVDGIGPDENGNVVLTGYAKTEDIRKVYDDIREVYDDIRKVYDDIQYFITPEMFGAKGDGISNDSEAINKAISNCSNGVVLLTGKYNIGDNSIDFTHKNNVSLVGNGMAVIYHSSLNAVFFGSQSDVVLEENDNNNSIENIIFDYTGSAPYDDKPYHATIYVKALGRSTIKNCRTRNRQQFLYLRNTSNVNVKDCTLDGKDIPSGAVGYDCIYCDNDGAQNMSLKISNVVAHMGCCSELYTRGLYMVGDNRDAMILDCEFDACTEAIRIYTSGKSPLSYDITIENLISDLFRATAIHVENCDKGQVNIRGCWLSGQYKTEENRAINVVNSGCVNLSENQIQQDLGGSNCTGVRFTGSKGCICSNNIFYDSKRCVMVENACVGINVIGNAFYAKTRTDLEYCVKLDGSQNCVASLNTGYSDTENRYDCGVINVNSTDCVIEKNACKQVANINEV